MTVCVPLRGLCRRAPRTPDAQAYQRFRWRADTIHHVWRDSSRARHMFFQLRFKPPNIIPSRVCLALGHGVRDAFFRLFIARVTRLRFAVKTSACLCALDMISPPHKKAPYYFMALFFLISNYLISSDLVDLPPLSGVFFTVTRIPFGALKSGNIS